MNRILSTAILLAAFCHSIHFQTATASELILTLDEVITMARTGSVEAAVALDELRSAYWEWRSYRADQLPEITLSATAPSYVRQYTSYMDSDGSYSFVATDYLRAQGELSIIQNIRLTGGRLSLSSSLDFMRMLGTPASSRFMTVPVALTLTQPLFGVNTMKWDSRIAPVRYSEAKATFLSATENVALIALQYYFTLLLSREKLATAQQNLANAERLYAVAEEKRHMGQISQNDLLQMEMNLINARSEVTECRSTVRSDMFVLRSFLGLEEDLEIIPVTPSRVPVSAISYSDALSRALANNRFARGIRRRQLEAEYEVAHAKGNLRQINLFAQIGFTGTDRNVSDAYSNLRASRVAEIGISIPLVDWGKRRGKVKVAESNRRVTESRLRQETIDFSQQMFILIERFCNQQEQLTLAERSSEIARRRYETNVETFLIGQISTLDLNDSQSKKDEYRLRYINELYKFWSYWYQIRSLTLYDYEHRTDIDADIARIVR